MFFGLLTLVNAPFDWLAIGLTRALLRRGLAPGGWGPFRFALLDAVLGTLLVVALAFVTVFAVQTFNDVTALRAGDEKIIYPLGILFQGLQNHPADPQYWWVWLTLFSTQIPAALNLCIASASLFRGWPWVTLKIIARMPAERPVPEKQRIWLALALAAQITVGGLAAAGLLCGLIFWLIPLGMPWLGEHLLAYTRDAWVPNYPARFIVWLLSGGRDMGQAV